MQIDRTSFGFLVATSLVAQACTLVDDSGDEPYSRTASCARHPDHPRCLADAGVVEPDAQDGSSGPVPDDGSLPTATATGINASYRPAAGPLGVSCPSGSISVAPGQSLQSAINAAPEGAVFCLENGTHVIGASVVPRNNQQFVGRTGGSVLVRAATARAYMFMDGNNTGRTGVQIRGLIVDGFGPDAPGPAAIRGVDGWVIERNEVRNGATCIVAYGVGCKVLNNLVHHCGSGIGSFQGRNALIQNNEVAFNTADQKFVGTTGFVIRGNYYHDNGAGIWMDTENRDYLIESNLSMRTVGRRGLESEQDCGPGVIRHNWSEANAASGILITASQGNEVYGNIVVGNGAANGIDGGIIVAHQPRSSGSCQWTVTNTHIHDNWVVPKSGALAAGIFLFNTTDTAILSGSDDRVRFEGNHYYVSDLAGRFWLLGGAGTTRTFSQWRDAGNDTVGGSVVKFP